MVVEGGGEGLRRGDREKVGCVIEGGYKKEMKGYFRLRRKGIKE